MIRCTVILTCKAHRINYVDEENFIVLQTVDHMGRIYFTESFGTSSLLFLIAFSSFACRVIFLLFESSAVHSLYSSL